MDAESPLFASPTGRVRLQVSVPELELEAGEVGRIISAWFYPNTAYEVEFPAKPNGCIRRALLLENQICPN